MSALNEMFVGRFVHDLFMKKYMRCSDLDIQTFFFFFLSSL